MLASIQIVWTLSLLIVGLLYHYSLRVLVAQSCPTLCSLMDSSLLGSSVHGIFQARILEWVAIAFSRGSSWPKNRTQVSCIADRFFIVWTTKEAHPLSSLKTSALISYLSSLNTAFQNSKLCCPSYFTGCSISVSFADLSSSLWTLIIRVPQVSGLGYLP